MSLLERSKHCPCCRKESKLKHCKSRTCNWFKCECLKNHEFMFLVFDGIHFFKSRGV